LIFPASVRLPVLFSELFDSQPLRLALVGQIALLRRGSVMAEKPRNSLNKAEDQPLATPTLTVTVFLG
jgi:hypothetical protein